MIEQLISMDVYINLSASNHNPEGQALAKDQALHSASEIFKADGWRELRELRAGKLWQCPGDGECEYRIGLRAILHCHITVSGFGVKVVV